ncbi:stage IV sporulation protein A [Clostridium senegalense]|uniref:stage IV sporulation protein A n=1 Tax=Clostridium senegalense TaxID=1465809 RepID=UPI001C0F951C|nr:stage IV sporulation protein A [Clostridium senegalense]MBU5225625.1 stage IV sporulation protein A [Clostridium senegalense]
MENFNIYNDIAERTQGDIYVGVVGPVRTGKSTFIKRFMEMMVIPNIENEHKKERAKDELPQSGSGKSIHTTEPKFVPNEAIEIKLENGALFKVRMVDCVGYIVKNALGYNEEQGPKMVNTPWFDYEIPFEEAAEIGTKKVINDHSTIGIVMTTDGSIAGLDREEYVEAEERVISELKSINKPFIILCNCKDVNTEESKNLRKEMEEKYDIPVQLVNVMELDKEGVSDIFSNVLKEFPVKEINIDMPQWIEELDSKHWLKVNIMSALKDMSGEITKVRDITKILESLDGLDNLSAIKIKEMKMGDGTSRLDILPKKELFYKILGETCSIDIENESQLLKMMESFYKAKVEYDKVKDALIDVNNTGYGLVAPQLSEMKLEVPELINSGARKGIKLKASAPSLHIIRADVETEVPIVGTEKQSEDFYKAILDQFENDPSQIWQSNMFGKPLEEIVKEGLQSKLYKMPDDVQNKLQRTLQKIINEGSGGLICIIL